MSGAPYLKLYPGDYHADTQDLTCEQHGAYLLLLMSMWTHGGSLPFDHEILRRVAKLTPARWRKVWAIIERFFHVENGRLTQGRLREEREKIDGKSTKNRRAGKLGGEAKSRKRKETALANATQTLGHITIAIEEKGSEETTVSEDTSVSSAAGAASTRADEKVVRLEDHREPDPDEDPVKIMFDRGVPWLLRHGVTSEAAARTMIGKWRKTAREAGRDDLAVLAAMRDARRLGVTDPKSYVLAALQPKDDPAARIAAQMLAEMKAGEA